MSDWNNIDDECIEVDNEEKEVNILVTSNEWGNVYCILTFDQINQIKAKMDDL